MKFHQLQLLPKIKGKPFGATHEIIMLPEREWVSNDEMHSQQHTYS
jgi:hypothetical protein